MTVSKQQAISFYHTAAWKTARQMALRRDHYLCQRCKQQGIIKQGNIVHHVVALKDNWNKRLTLSNLETICAECHNEEHPEKAANYNNKQKYKRRQKKRDSAGVFKFKAGATF